MPGVFTDSLFVSIKDPDIFDLDGAIIAQGKLRVSQFYGFNAFSHLRRYRCVKSNQIVIIIVVISVFLFHAKFLNWLYWSCSNSVAAFRNRNHEVTRTRTKL